MGEPRLPRIALPLTLWTIYDVAAQGRLCRWSLTEGMKLSRSSPVSCQSCAARSAPSSATSCRSAAAATDSAAPLPTSSVATHTARHRSASLQHCTRHARLLLHP